MNKKPHISLFDLCICLSDACDAVSPALVNHHRQVAYMALRIGGEMGLTNEQLTDLALAGILHDIGLLSFHDPNSAVTADIGNNREHSENGYSLLQLFPPLRQAAAIVRYHHTRWDARNRNTISIAVESDIIHAVECVAALIDNGNAILGQVERVVTHITKERGRMLRPEVVDAFTDIAPRECFWLDAISPPTRFLTNLLLHNSVVPDIEQLHSLTTMFSRIIDFRSRFTAAHSAGVAATASSLAHLAGFSPDECEHMKIAGFLHDLGKLAVPRSIIEKAGKLTDAEKNVIHTHSYFTYRILDPLVYFDTIKIWAAYHHEKLNGNGYPFHLEEKDLPAGSRIMSVSDVYMALSEDRPYRVRIPQKNVFRNVWAMVKTGSIDGDIVRLLELNADEISSFQLQARKEALALYDSISGHQN